MAPDNWQTLTDMFFSQAHKLGDKPFLSAKIDGAYQSKSWAETADEVMALAGALVEKGVKPGDRVLLVSENRPEWCVADLAIMAAGAIAVPTYTTNTSRDHLHILENSAAVGSILSTKALAKNFFPAAHQSDALKFVICIEDPAIGQHLNFEAMDYQQCLESGKAHLSTVRKRMDSLTKEDTACLIYTSGTGGAPKGVMLPHRAIMHNCRGAYDVLMELGIKDEVFLSFLPLSHAYEHSGGQFFPIYTGSEIYYAQSLDKLAANLQETRPTIMMVVPRLFEMLRQRISAAIKKEGGLKAKLFDKAIEIGTKRIEGRLSILDRIIDPFLTMTVRKKVQQRFGGRMKALVSGGAPLNPDVGSFFQALGLRLLQGYGQTEAGPVVSVNRPSLVKMDTVGPAVTGAEVRIADDGEILVQGDLVMQGYWRDETATNKAIINGWLHTGDIGHIDHDGHIKITDRKKDIIVNDKGDNVSPQRIEGMLALEPEIMQAMVYGDKRPHLVALIVPDPEWLSEWCQKHDVLNDIADLIDNRDLHKALDEAVRRVNERLSNLEKVRRFTLAKEAFTIENAQMTPTLKIRRHVISKLYEQELVDLY